ncbi:MAG: HipA family kinase [Chitinophagales bacterium]
MTKLTYQKYRLPVVEALNSFDLFETGTTAPMAIWGVDSDTGERDRFVVKFKKHNRMTPVSSAFEFLGAWMAIEIGLPAAEPVVVNISDDFVSTLLGRDGYKAASQSLGFNFGTRYNSGITQIPQIGFKLNDTMLEQAKLLFAFDLFIQNIDRGHQKPNVGTNGEELFVYDHELAFSFIHQLPFLRSKTPWVLSSAESELYKKHFFYKRLKEEQIDFTAQVDKMDCFNDYFWNEVFTKIPKEFQVDKIKYVISYLKLTLDHRSEFVNSLNKIIAS